MFISPASLIFIIKCACQTVAGNLPKSWNGKQPWQWQLTLGSISSAPFDTGNIPKHISYLISPEFGEVGTSWKPWIVIPSCHPYCSSCQQQGMKCFAKIIKEITVFSFLLEWGGAGWFTQMINTCMTLKGSVTNSQTELTCRLWPHGALPNLCSALGCSARSDSSGSVGRRAHHLTGLPRASCHSRLDDTEGR